MNIVAIGAHPDDIEFGCGGTLLKLARKKHALTLFIATEGEINAPAGVRKKEQMRSADFMGIKKVYWGGYSDTHVPTNKELIDTIETIVNRARADTVFFPSLDDIHQDHRAVAQCALSATRYIKNVLLYEVPSTRRFDPTMFSDITTVITDKMKLLRLHHSQVPKTRVPKLTIIESAQACAIFRGYQGRVKFAEGFSAVRTECHW